MFDRPDWFEAFQILCRQLPASPNRGFRAGPRMGGHCAMRRRNPDVANGDQLDPQNSCRLALFPSLRDRILCIAEAEKTGWLASCSRLSGLAADTDNGLPDRGTA